ncbi:MAG: hypothetical protein WCR67_03450 [Bacilli bacterium]
MEKNIAAEKRLNMFHLQDGIYFIENAFGKVHCLKEENSCYGDKQYCYTGRIHKGLVSFVTGKDLSNFIPVKGNWDYGFTLEGLAGRYFEAENALVKENLQEKRKFVYINSKSTLSFIGDSTKKYNLYIRIFDKNYTGQTNFRWITIYLEEAR